jgi:hypothetical protein
MDKLEKDKQEIKEMVSEMAMAVKVSFAVLQLETPELADAFVQAWREQLDALEGKAKPKSVVTQTQQRKAMLSQPMGGKTEEEITATRERAMATLQEKGFTVVNTLFTDEWYSKEAMAERGVVQIPLCFLAKSLENMSLCHAAYFCKGWENARGCRIEHEAAMAYGLEIIYEDQ